MKNFRYLALPALLSLVACDPDREVADQLIGRWQAVEITEEDRPLQVDPTDIQFGFYPDGTYEFQSTLNYREAGAFSVHHQKYLLTTDTLRPGAAEKAVEILQIAPDTLRLGMQQNGARRKMVMVKEKETEKPKNRLTD